MMIGNLTCLLASVSNDTLKFD